MPSNYEHEIECLIAGLGSAACAADNLAGEHGSKFAPFDRVVLTQMHADLRAMLRIAQTLRPENN